MNKKTAFLIAILLLVFGVFVRVMPHMWNATPIAAIAIFASLKMNSRYALFLPVGVLFLSDILIGFYDPRLMLTVYGSFLIISVLGIILKKKSSWINIPLLTFFSPILFFLLTNWAVWQFSSWYGPTISGLFYSYSMGMPFLRAMLIGDVIYTTSIFTVYYAAINLVALYKNQKSLAII